MNISEAKERFIQAWGAFGSEWGVNRTMAQVHALLLISENPLCADDIMEKLMISRGNANMNIRALIDWGLAFKELKPGDRKEYFVAEKDMWNIVRKIAIQRRKKELEPVLKTLEEVAQLTDTNPEAEEFIRVTQNIKTFALRADNFLDLMINAATNCLLSSILNKTLRNKD